MLAVSVLLGPYLGMVRSLNHMGIHWWILGRGLTWYIKMFLNIILAAVLRIDDKEARIEVGEAVVYSSGRGWWWLWLEGDDGGEEKRWDSSHVLKLELTGFADRLMWTVSGLTLRLERPFPGLRRLRRCRFRRDDQEFSSGHVMFETCVRCVHLGLVSMQMKLTARVPSILLMNEWTIER